MFADGVIGNLGILEVLGTLTAGQFNKVLQKGDRAYKLRDIIPQVHDYLYPPQPEQDNKQKLAENFLAFAYMVGGKPPSSLLGEDNG